MNTNCSKCTFRHVMYMCTKSRDCGRNALYYDKVHTCRSQALICKASNAYDTGCSHATIV